MVLTEEQTKELREARKITSRSPKFNPTIHQWRTFRAQFHSWLNMNTGGFLLLFDLHIIFHLFHNKNIDFKNNPQA